MDFQLDDKLITRLRTRLEQPLPGIVAQLKMTSIRNIRQDPHFTIPEDARASGVLLLLYPSGGQTKIVFIRRPDYGGVHSGQISFPGGQAEPGDITPAETALRESREEIGIVPGEVRILGQLSELYIPPSRFLVRPFVGYTKKTPAFVPDPAEVAEVLEFPLAGFFERDVVREQEIFIREDRVIKAPAYVINGHVIWGATAMIMSEFLEVLNPGSSLRG
jgi:8-oxo-dGTP pyrophosphatase MutT (NUDIX family)